MREAFEKWKGDLIVSSLRARSLFHVLLEGDSAVMIETIPVYERVRDILRDSRGRLIIWTDSAAIGILQQSNHSP